MPAEIESQRISIDHRLYKAVRDGDINLLENLLTAEREQQLQQMRPGEEVATLVADGGDYLLDGPFKSLLGVTCNGDTALHIAAYFGHLEVARKIFNRNRSLLLRGNNKLETPLHYAAQTGQYELVHEFIHVARVEPEIRNSLQSESADVLKELLRGRNKDGETALYQAVHNKHSSVVDILINEDPLLASIPDNENSSPLYLAVMRAAPDIVNTLIRSLQGNVSLEAHAGPEGKTALHAAALRKRATVQIILNWKPELANVVDDNGSTPLHFAAANGNRDAVEVLLEKDRSSAYVPDLLGIFPVHVATKLGNLRVLTLLFELCPDSGQLLDSRGRNLLHIAVENKLHHVVRWACNNNKLQGAMNAKDDNGNTPMHLAVKARDMQIFSSLLGNKKVDKGIMNKKGLTPLDLAAAQITVGLIHWQNPEYVIFRTLKGINSGMGIRRDDHFLNEHKLTNDQDKIDIEAESHEQMSKNLSIGAVLIASASFAGVFTVSNSYKADYLSGSTLPVLNVAFKSFVLMIAYAFICSITATGLLIVSALTILDSKHQRRNLIICIELVMLSARGFVAAFAVGAYVMLFPVSKWFAVLVCFTGVVVPTFLHPLQFPNFLVSRALTRLLKWNEIVQTGNVANLKTHVPVRFPAIGDQIFFLRNNILFGFLVLLVLVGSLINISGEFFHGMVLACVTGLLLFTCVRFFFMHVIIN